MPKRRSLPLSQLPRAPAEYNVAYMDRLISEIQRISDRVDQPGDIQVRRLTISDLPEDVPDEPSVGDLYRVGNEVRVVTRAYFGLFDIPPASVTFTGSAPTVVIT